MPPIFSVCRHAAHSITPMFRHHFARLGLPPPLVCRQNMSFISLAIVGFTAIRYWPVVGAFIIALSRH